MEISDSQCQLFSEINWRDEEEEEEEEEEENEEEEEREEGVQGEEGWARRKDRGGRG